MMKKRLLLASALALILVLVPITASGSAPVEVLSSEPNAALDSGSMADSISTRVALMNDPTIDAWYTLTAAQHYYVGDIGVWVEDSNLNVLIQTRYWENECYMTETHLAVGETLADIPQTRSGNPKVGNFPYSMEYDTPVGSEIYTFPIPDGGFPVIMAVHAVVTCPDWDEPETAWGSQCTQCCDFPGRSWATWFQYPKMGPLSQNMMIFSRPGRQP